MATFTVYSYQFRPLFEDQPSLFPEDNLSPEKVWERKQGLFKSIFGENLHFQYRSVTFSHEVIYNENELIVLRIANNKKITQESQFVTKKLDHNPSCVIIIDNRKDVQNLYIEDDPYSFSDPSVVANILEKTFNVYLEAYGLGISLNKRFKSHEFWDVVAEADNGIEMVRFSFLYPNLPRVQEKIDEMLSKTSRNVHSKKTNIEFNSGDGEALQIDKGNEDLNNLVSASSESGSVIKVKKKGSRRHTEVGSTSEMVEIEDLDAALTSDLLSSAAQKLMSILNRFKF